MIKPDTVVFSESFVYVPDDKDEWRILKPIDDMYFGDCEDYALTYLFLYSGKSWTKFWLNLITRSTLR